MRGLWLVMLAVAAAPALGQQPMNPPTQAIPEIITAGVGEYRIQPDRARINVAVETRAATAAEAAAENARVVRRVLDALRALGLESDQLSTIGYRVMPEHRFEPEGGRPPKVTGYVVTNIVSAELRQIDMVGRVIDSALSAGANRIDGLWFYASDTRAAEQEALRDAVSDARAAAEALASAAGGRLGDIIQLDATGYGPPRPMMEMAAMGGVARADVRTPIEPGEQTVTARVVVRWRYLQSR